MEPTLYVVATPIGSLRDLSPRAEEALREAAFVACEDTRHSIKLLRHLNISCPLESLHQHNEEAKVERLVERLLESSPNPCAAVISDAGMPCISDPGARLVAACRNAGVRIVVVPGPSAIVAALAGSGFLRPRHLFAGFLPRSEADRDREFSRWEPVAPVVCVFFESPQRLVGALESVARYWGEDVEVCVSREISKIHEEHLSGAVSAVIATLQKRGEVLGECVVCVDVAEGVRASAAPIEVSLAKVAEEIVAEAEKNPDLHLRSRIKARAGECGLSAKALYAEVQRLRDQGNEES